MELEFKQIFYNKIKITISSQQNVSFFIIPRFAKFCNISLYNQFFMTGLCLHFLPHRNHRSITMCS